LFEKYNIDLVISGHDHNYQRIEKEEYVNLPDHGHPGKR